MEDIRGLSKDLAEVLVSMMIYFFIFCSLFTLSNVLIDTEFLVPNYALLCTLVWSAYKIIR